jgi:arylsulfatase A-like enzyme
MRIVFVTIDCGRAAEVYDPRTAPVLADRILPRARVFRNHYANVNITVPSLLSILTGDHPKNFGVFGNHAAAGALRRTFLTDLAGPRKVFLSNAAFLGHPALRHTCLHHFDWKEIFQYGPAETRRLTDRALLTVRDETDLFLWVHYFDAHEPYGFVPKKGIRTDFMEHTPYMKIRNNRGTFEGATFEDLEAGYLANLRLVDGEVGRIFDALGAEDVLAVSADHGEALGENGIYFSHSGIFLPTIHVPMLIAGPGWSGEEAAPTNHVDLAPTFLDLAGATVPESMRGRSLRTSPPADREIFVQSVGNAAAAVLHDGWQYIRNLLPRNERKETQLHSEHLVDLDSGTDHLSAGGGLPTDLAGRRDRLAAALDAWLRDVRPLAMDPWEAKPRPDDDLADELRSLGYL